MCCFLSLRLFLPDFASIFSFIILLLVSYSLVGAEGTCGALGALSCFILFLLWLLFLSIKSSMYSVKEQQVISAHSSSFKSTFQYSFIAALRPLHIVSWCSSIAPLFIAAFSLSLCCPHQSLSSKPLHLRPSLYFASIRLSLSKDLHSSVQAFSPPLIQRSSPKSPPNSYQASYRAHISWLHSQFCTAPYSGL